jgi:transcriptional regulator
MYNLPYFKEADKGIVLEFIRDNPFAFLCGCDELHKPIATQVPILVEEREDKIFLYGHMMRQTDHCKAFELNDSVLSVFTGPAKYVSATWYSNPQQASTWNYLSVHLHGKIRFLDAQGLSEILRKTTLHFENNNDNSSTVFDNLPPAYRDSLLPLIIGFEIQVMKMDNVFKLSQNKDKESYYNIIRQLEITQEGKALADEMKSRGDILFAQ